MITLKQALESTSISSELSPNERLALIFKTLASLQDHASLFGLAGKQDLTQAFDIIKNLVEIELQEEKFHNN